MIKNISFLILFLMGFLNCSAIEWVDVPNPKNKYIQLDKDSIYTDNEHLFYNVKILNSKNEYRVITIQSALKHAYCAKLKDVSIDEYTAMNGDYKNITSNQKDNLEMSVYGSVAHSSFVLVKRILNSKNMNVVIQKQSSEITIE